MQQQLESQLSQTLRSLTSHNLQTRINNLLKSSDCQTYLILQHILSRLSAQSPKQHQYAIYYIEKGMCYVQNFVLLLFLYQKFIIQAQGQAQRFSFYKWKNKFKGCLENGDGVLFVTWVESQPDALIVQSTLRMLASTIPIFFKNQFINISQNEIRLIIHIIKYLKTTTPELIQYVVDLAKISKPSSHRLEKDPNRLQQLFFKQLLEATSNSHSFPNAFLLISSLGLQKQDIGYFCHIQNKFIFELTQDSLCNIFSNLTKSGAKPITLHIIDKICYRLLSEGQFFKLKVIARMYILPVLARRVKTCEFVQQQVYQICQFFGLGFLKTYNFGEQGISCLIRNVGKITNKKIQQKWLSLIKTICKYHPQLEQRARKLLEKEFVKVPESEQYCQQMLQNDQIVWQIELRNSRKLKQYEKKKSSMLGIINQQNECYIISAVQALQKSTRLGDLMELAVKQGIDKYGVCYQICILFEQIAGIRDLKGRHIKITYLKQKGPQQFAKNFEQEDSFEYLIKLLESIEKQLKPYPKLLKKLKQIFEIEYKTEYLCEKCKNTKKCTQLSYSITIPHTQTLSQTTTEQLPDYFCSTCNTSTSCRLTHTLSPSCQILIVHINRFSHRNGIAIKQKDNCEIKRQFMGYRLVGMICHNGKNVEIGHYVYYHRIAANRWACFNDLNVEEFLLDQDDEMFQLQFKAQLTPYILFYQDMGKSRRLVNRQEEVEFFQDD